MPLSSSAGAPISARRIAATTNSKLHRPSNWNGYSATRANRIVVLAPVAAREVSRSNRGRRRGRGERSGGEESGERSRPRPAELLAGAPGGADSAPARSDEVTPAYELERVFGDRGRSEAARHSRQGS